MPNAMCATQPADLPICREMSIDALLDRLDSNDAGEPCHAVLDALGLRGGDRGWTGAQSRRVAVAIARHASSSSATTRSKVAGVIGRLGLRGPSIGQLLLHLLEDPTDEVRAAAMCAIACDPILIGLRPTGKHLSAGLVDGSRLVRIAAMAGVASVGPRVIPSLTPAAAQTLANRLFQHLESTDHREASRAARTLFGLIQRDLLRAQEVVEYLEGRPVTWGGALLLCTRLDGVSELYLLRAAGSCEGRGFALKHLARRGPADLAAGLLRVKRSSPDAFLVLLREIQWGNRGPVWQEALERMLWATEAGIPPTHTIDRPVDRVSPRSGATNQG